MLKTEIEMARNLLAVKEQMSEDDFEYYLCRVLPSYGISKSYAIGLILRIQSINPQSLD